MSTLRYLVSSVRAMHKLLSTDSLVTDRAIAAEIRTNSLLLIKRETNLRRLWQTDTLFTTIPCLEMVEVPISECCDYIDECTIARSKHKIPGVAEGNYQYVIQGVYFINALGGKGSKLKEITVNRYANILRLHVIKKEAYFWISNGYLYITNPLLQAVRFVAFFEEEVNNDIMFPECGCGEEYTEEEYCMNPLDKKFSLPGFLEQQVLALTSQKLLGTYFAIPTDLTTNGVDNQSPNSVENGK